jgi:hypothetical protein
MMTARNLGFFAVFAFKTDASSRICPIGRSADFSQAAQAIMRLFSNQAGRGGEGVVRCD